MGDTPGEQDRKVRWCAETKPAAQVQLISVSYTAPSVTPRPWLPWGSPSALREHGRNQLCFPVGRGRGWRMRFCLELTPVLRTQAQNEGIPRSTAESQRPLPACPVAPQVPFSDSCGCDFASYPDCPRESVSTPTPSSGVIGGSFRVSFP